MKILLVTTPRVGGTNYGKQLSLEYQVPYINEPWGYTANMGYSEQRKAQALADLCGDDFVIHSQAHDVDMSIQYDKVINLQRRDIKAQISSYIVAYNDRNFGYRTNIHGSYKADTVTLKILLMEIGFQRRKFDAKYPPVFYEDLNLLTGNANQYHNINITNFPTQDFIDYFLNDFI